MLSQEPAVENDFWKYPQKEAVQIRPCQVELLRIPQHVDDRLHFRKSLRLDNLPWPLDHASSKGNEVPKGSGVRTHNPAAFVQAEEDPAMVQRPNGSVRSNDTREVIVQHPGLNGDAEAADGSGIVLKNLDGDLVEGEMSVERGSIQAVHQAGAKVFSGLELQEFSRTGSDLSESAASIAQRENSDSMSQVFGPTQRVEHPPKTSNIFDALSQSSEKACELLNGDVPLMCSWALKSSCFLKDCRSLDKDSFQSQGDQSQSNIVEVLCSTDEKEYEADESSQPDAQDIDCASSESLRFYDMLLSSDEASSDSVTAGDNTKVLSVSDNKDILSDVLDKVFFGDENSDSSSKDLISPGALQWHADPGFGDHFKQSENVTETEELKFTSLLNSSGLSVTDHSRSVEKVDESIATLVQQLVHNVCLHDYSLCVNTHKMNDDSNAFPKDIIDTKTCSSSLQTIEMEDSVSHVIESLVTAVSSASYQHGLDNQNHKCFMPLSAEETEESVSQVSVSSTDVLPNSEESNSIKSIPTALPNAMITNGLSLSSSRLVESGLTADFESSKSGTEPCSLEYFSDSDQVACKNMDVVEEIVRTVSPDSSGIPTIPSSDNGTVPNRTPSPESPGGKKLSASKRKLDSPTYSVITESGESSQSQTPIHETEDAKKDGKVPKLVIVKDAGISSNPGKNFVSKIVSDKCKKSSLKMSFKKVPPKLFKDGVSKQVGQKSIFGHGSKAKKEPLVSQSFDRFKQPSSMPHLEVAKDQPFDPYNFEYEDELYQHSKNLEVPKLLHLPLSRSPSPSLLCYASVDSNHVIKSVNLEVSEADDTKEVSSINDGVQNLMQFLVTNVKDATACWKNRRGSNLKPITEDMLEDMADELGREFEFDREDIESFKQSAKNILTMVETVHQKKRRKWSRGCLEKRKPKLLCKDKEEDHEKVEKPSDLAEEASATAPKTDGTVQDAEDELSRLSEDVDSYQEKRSVTPSPSLSSVDNEPEGSQDSCYFASHCKRLSSLRNRRKRSAAADLEGMLTRMRSLRNRGGDDVLTVDFDDPIPLEYKERRKKRHRRAKMQAYDSESAKTSPGAPEDDSGEVRDELSPKCNDETPESPLVVDEGKAEDNSEPEKLSPADPACRKSEAKGFASRKQGSSRHTWLSSRWSSKKRKWRISSDEEYPPPSQSGNEAVVDAPSDVERSSQSAVAQSEEPKTDVRLESTTTPPPPSPSPTATDMASRMTTSETPEVTTSTESQQELTIGSSLREQPPCSEDCSTTVTKDDPLDLSRWTSQQQATSTVDNQKSVPSSPKSDIGDKDLVLDIDEYISEDSPLPAAPAGIVSSTSKFESSATTATTETDLGANPACKRDSRSESSLPEDMPPLEEVTHDKPPSDPMAVEDRNLQPPELVAATDVVEIDTDNDSGMDELPRITSVISLATSETLTDDAEQNLVAEATRVESSPKLSAFQRVASKQPLVPAATQTSPAKKSSATSTVNDAHASAMEAPAETVERHQEKQQKQQQQQDQQQQQPCQLSFPLSLSKDMFNAQYERLRNELMTLELIARQKERERNNIIRLKLYKQSVMKKLQLKKAIMQQQMQFQAQMGTLNPSGSGFMAAPTVTSANGKVTEKPSVRYPPIAPRLFPPPVASNYYLVAQAAAANSASMQAQAKQVPTVSSSQSIVQKEEKKHKDAQETKTADGANTTNSAANVPPKPAHSLPNPAHGDKVAVSKSSSFPASADADTKANTMKSGRNDPNSSLSSVETIVAKANENFGLQFQNWIEDNQRMLQHPYYQHAALAATGAQPPVKLDVSPKSILESSLRTPPQSRGLPLYGPGLLTDVVAGDKRGSRSLDDVIRNVYSRKFHGVTSLPSFVPGFPMTALYNSPMLQVPAVGNLGFPVFPQKGFAPATSTAGPPEMVAKSEAAAAAAAATPPKRHDKVPTPTPPFQHSTLAKLLMSPLPDSKTQKETSQDDGSSGAAKDKPETGKKASPPLPTGNVLSSSSSSSAWKPVDKNSVKWPICTSCKLMYARFICAGCNSQWYCSEPCQVRDWKYHFKSCRRV